ncbi:MAG: hypothetical protein N2203_02425 [Bacteroidia bacterium]|nr:hypothetical protein [Bacteroidia bacterium]
MKHSVFVMLIWLLLGIQQLNADTIPKYKVNYDLWISPYAHSVGFGWLKKHVQYEVGAIWFPNETRPFQHLGQIGLSGGLKYFPEKFDKRWNMFLSSNVLTLYSNKDEIQSISWYNCLLAGVGIQYQLTRCWYLNFQVYSQLFYFEYRRDVFSNSPAVTSYNWDFYYPFFEDNFNSVLGLYYVF